MTTPISALVPIEQKINTYRVQELLTFSKIKNQKDPNIRKQMTTALIINLRGHHEKAWEMFRDAINQSKGQA